MTSMITRAGTPKVKPGDEVEKGQILVSGIVDVYNDAKEVVNQRPVSADADILYVWTFLMRNICRICMNIRNTPAEKRQGGCLALQTGRLKQVFHGLR